MDKIWGSDHGQFVYEQGEWNGTVEFPAFKLFRYQKSTVSRHDPPEQVPVCFEIEQRAPTKEMVELFNVLFDGQDKLVALLANALMDDINGDGPGSGMWWEGDPDAIESVIGVELPEDPIQNCALLSISGIVIRQDSPISDGCIAEINFDAAFDEEHGCAFLTDGKEVFGIGQISAVDPF